MKRHGLIDRQVMTDRQVMDWWSFYFIHIYLSTVCKCVRVYCPRCLQRFCVSAYCTQLFTHPLPICLNSSLAYRNRSRKKKHWWHCSQKDTLKKKKENIWPLLAPSRFTHRYTHVRTELHKSGLQLRVPSKTMINISYMIGQLQGWYMIYVTAWVRVSWSMWFWGRSRSRYLKSMC